MLDADEKDDAGPADDDLFDDAMTARYRFAVPRFNSRTFKPICQ